MGRKIPAKKHRGVKDPLAQQAKRVQILKNKINAPPVDPDDDQPIPRSLTRLFDFQNKKQENDNKHKKTKKTKLKTDQLVRTRNRNPVSSLRRMAGESGRAFSLRINSAIKTLSAPDNYEYMEDMESEDVKGDAMAERREKRARKRARSKAGGGGEPGGGDGGPRGDRLTRGQKLTQRKKARKLKAAEESASRAEAGVYERVEFGEVAHAPPSLPAPRRAPDNRHTARRDLLLYSMLGAGAGAGAARGAVTSRGADAARRERARLDAVAAYRAIKSQRQKQPPNVLT